MLFKVRVPESPLSRLLALLAAIVVTDLLIASAVFIDRSNDTDVPDFNMVSLVGISLRVSPYRTAPEILGFPQDLRPPDNGSSPDARIKYAISALARFETTRDDRWLRRARALVQDVLDGTDEGLVAHRRKTTDLLGRPVPTPWYAADSQGLLLSALARLEDLTGDPRWRDSADAVFAALVSFQGFFSGSRPAPTHWLSLVDGDEYVWFDRFSTGLTSSRVLTEQLTTLFGIYDFRRVLADRPLERRQSAALLAGSLATVRHGIGQWRVPGRISISSLAVGNRDVRDHFTAGAQLTIVERITGRAWAEQAATDFARDNRLPYFPIKPITVRKGVDVYSPLPAAIRRLARNGRPPREARASDAVATGAITDQLKSAAQALEILDGATEPADLRRAGAIVEGILATAQDGAVAEHGPMTDVFGSKVDSPWYSAASQGLLLSALARLHDQTGEQKWKREADRVYAALTRVRDYGDAPQTPWLGLVDFSGYLWFDENFGPHPLSRSTFEHIVALVGLYDYWELTGRKEARQYFRGGLTTIRDARPYFRRAGQPAVESLATGLSEPAYHDLIATEIEALAAITADTDLVQLGRRLRQDRP